MKSFPHIWFLGLSYESLKCSFSHGQPPSVWPKGGTLKSVGGPCLSGASWSALLRLASVPLNVARLGVTGFGSFCRNKRISAAGPKPGIYCEHKSLQKCHKIYGLHMIWGSKGTMNLKIQNYPSRIRMNTEADLVPFRCF